MNVGADEDEHIDADMPVCVVGPTDVRVDAADDMEQDAATQRPGHAKAHTHDRMYQ